MKERQKLVTDEQWELIETNAWLGQFRCLLVRPEHLLSTYYAFLYLA
ncbi:MAG TPA: hypothetical protein VL967_12565 [Terracidiphilus sp.]|nr:hypothetical protein [Terracidiphilus sp.]